MMIVECAELTRKKAVMLKLMTGFPGHWYGIVARLMDHHHYQDSSIHVRNDFRSKISCRITPP